LIDSDSEIFYNQPTSLMKCIYVVTCRSRDAMQRRWE